MAAVLLEGLSSTTTHDIDLWPMHHVLETTCTHHSTHTHTYTNNNNNRSRKSNNNNILCVPFSAVQNHSPTGTVPVGV